MTHTSYADHETRLAAGRACLEAAFQYLGLGFSVTCCCDPDHVGVGKAHGRLCDSPGKTPMHKWKEWQSRLPSQEEIERHWQTFPYGNVGVVLGQISGLVRVDVDGEAGEVLLQTWSQGDILPTWEFRSSGTGRGLLYAWPKDLSCQTTAEGKAHTAHTEVRLMGNGSQTILPPSRHVSGAVYTWAPGHSPAECPLAPAPAWVVTRLQVTPSTTPPAMRHTACATPDYARVMQALATVPNQDLDYDCWLKVGMALHSTGQPWARELWDTWSQHSAKYDAAKQEKSWRSFHEDRSTKATLGTLFYLAQQAGWKPPQRTVEMEWAAYRAQTYYRRAHSTPSIFSRPMTQEAPPWRS